MVSQMTPYLPCYDGFRVIPAHLLRELFRRHELHLIAVADGGESTSQLEWPRAYCRSVEIVRPAPAPGLLTRVAQLRRGVPDVLAAPVRAALDRLQPEVLHLEGPATAPLARLAGPGTRVVLSAHDALSLRYHEFSRFATSRRTAWWHAARAVMARWSERRWYRHADRVVVTSPTDAAALAHAVPADRLTVIPNGVDLDYFGGRPEPVPGRLVFTGNMSWPPNEDAAEYFSLEVLPRIRRELPAATFWIVGADPSPRVRLLAEAPGVHMTGRVPDLRTWVQSASVYVSPLRFGAGVKNKILEAMALGTPIVATPKSLTGTPLVDGEDLLVAGTADDLARATLRLLGDEGLRQALSVTARRRVEREYSWQAIMGRFEQCYAQPSVRPRAGVEASRATRDAAPQILYASYYGDLGGGELRLLDHVRHSRFGPEAFRALLFTDGDLRRRLGALGISVELVVPPARWPRRLGELAVLVKTLGVLRRQRPKLVVCNTYRDLLRAGVAAACLRIPVIWRSRSDTFPEIHRKPALRRRALLLFLRYGVARILSTTEYDRELILGHGIPADRAFTAPNGVDTGTFAAARGQRAAIRKEFEIGDGEFLVGFVARMVPQKGYLDLLQALRVVVHRAPHVRGLIVGDVFWKPGEFGGYKDAVLAAIQDLDLAGTVVLAGQRADVPAIMNAIDVFVSASRLEPFGTTVIEAMAAGRPVVATRTAGSAEAVEDNVTGLLTPIGDPAALAEAILSLVGDPARAARLGQAGLRRARERYELTRTIRMLDDQCAAVASRAGARLLPGQVSAPRLGAGTDDAWARTRQPRHLHLPGVDVVKLPNFIIAGAAKCGTSSLYQYLRQHPEVFLPDRKEPNFFVTDPGHRNRMPEAEYRALFAQVTTEKAVGEASVAYLYDPGAPEAIYRYLGGDTRIVIILRNPVHMAYSLWGHMVRAAGEKLPFLDAVRAEPDRLRDEEFMRTAVTWSFNYAYTDRARYAPQVERYINRFGRSRVRVYLFEEFFAEPGRWFADLCRFLGIADTFVPEFVVHNPTDEPRSMTLQDALQHRRPWKEPIKRLLPARTRIWLKSQIFRLNRTRRKAMAPLPPEQRRAVWTLLEADVARLERLLGRPLRTLWAPVEGPSRIGAPAATAAGLP